MKKKKHDMIAFLVPAVDEVWHTKVCLILIYKNVYLNFFFV